MDDTLRWPVKQRELHNHHFDSTVWNDFPFLDDDIVVATYAKSGTTWTQQIVAQLVFQGDPDVAVSEISPWIDLRIPPREEKFALLAAQTHRRIVKTHLPVDALVFSPAAKYIYVARDGRDVLWSLYNHHVNANEFWYEAINDSPGRVGPPIGKPGDDVVAYFREWLANDGGQWWPFWENVRSWWEIRHLPNVLLIHFEALRRDLPGEIQRIADFLDIEIDPDRRDDIIEHCTFDWMKAHADQSAPMGGAIFEGGGASFINKGTNGRWRELLTAGDIADYEAKAREELGEACSDWLATGIL